MAAGVLVGIGMLIVLLLLFLGGAALFLSAGRVEAGPVEAGQAAEPGSRFGIDYTARPVAVEPLADGRWHVSVAIERLDSWSWRALEVDRVEVVGIGIEDVGARLVSPPPREPFPERFELVFRTEPVPADVEGLLSFHLSIEAKKHFGLSNARSLDTHVVTLAPLPAGASGR